MPNHVTNKVTIRCEDPIETHRVVSSLLNEDEDFDFNHVIPCPQEILDLGMVDSSDVRLAKGEQHLRGHGARNHEKVEIMRSNIQKYGYAYWYDWNRANWSTKWNAYSHRVIFDPYDEEGFKVALDQALEKDDPTASELVELMEEGKPIYSYVTLVFQTAWSAPMKVFEALADQHPSAKICVEFADEDIGHNCGRVEYHDGDIGWSPLKAGEEAGRFACEVTGYDYEEYLRDCKQM